jgi:hypothetical protein
MEHNMSVQFRHEKPFNPDGRLLDFHEVAVGQRFQSVGRKRLVTCLKIGPSDYKGHIVNAVVLLDHADNPANDLGLLLFIERNEQVEVRPES